MKTLISILVCATVLANNVLADQVCADDIDQSAPDGRFAIKDLGETVLDQNTNLVWHRCPLGYIFSDSDTPEQYTDDRCLPDTQLTFGWQEALQAVEALDPDGRRRLRVPNVKELSSLVESSCAWPAINTYVFPDTPVIDFWSSTPNNQTGARTVSFDSGLVTSGARNVTKAVRVVTGGSIS